MTVPSPGDVVLTVRLPAGLDPDQELYVWLLPRGEEGAARWELVDPSLTGPVDVAYSGVLPAHYEAVARRKTANESTEVGWEWEDVTARTALTVRPEETTRAQVGP